MSDRISHALLGVNLRNTLNGMQESLDRLETQNDAQAAHLRAALATLELANAARLESARELRDDLPALRERLAVARASDRYVDAFADAEPLITVRIPAWRKTEELIDRAIASVLRQTYERFEIIVVNDGPNAVTRDAIAKLGDKRITYLEFPEQNRYPADQHLRWMVAGAPGMNLGAERATGTWIAPLDDDDEFSADHLEKLLGLAIAERAELAYGALLQKHLTWNTEQIIWSDPPAISQFSFMGAIYLKQLDFFRYDEQSWKVEEPGDWNLIRRMSAAGVRMAATPDVVGTMYSVSYASKE